MAARGQRSKIDQIWLHKSHFGSAFRCCSSDLDKIWHEHTSWPYKQVCARIYQLRQNPRWPPEVKGPKLNKFDSTNHSLARHLDLVHQIWTKFGMNILLDPTNKPVEEFLIQRQDSRRGSNVLKSTKFDPTNDISARHFSPVYPIWAKYRPTEQISTPMFSRVRNAMKLQFLFYDHSNSCTGWFVQIGWTGCKCRAEMWFVG